MDKGEEEGGHQVECENEDPRIRTLYESGAG